ncbi:MAG: ABC transporter ATP-binding protein [Bdellovibrionota bacterium]
MKHFLIGLENITYQIGYKTIFDRFSFHVEKNIHRCVVGPNGSGKTTLLKMLAGWIHPTKGQRLAFGPEHSNPSTDLMQKQIGICLTQPALFDALSIQENFLWISKLAGQSAISTDALEDMEHLGISGLMDRKPPTLSSGERQKFSLIRSWMLSPHVLLLDEPTSFLDEQSRAPLIEILHKKAQDTTIVIATHDTQLMDQLQFHTLALPGKAL